MHELRLDTWSGVQKFKVEFNKFKLNFQCFASIVNCENCSGDKIKRC